MAMGGHTCCCDCDDQQFAHGSQKNEKSGQAIVALGTQLQSNAVAVVTGIDSLVISRAVHMWMSRIHFGGLVALRRTLANDERNSEYVIGVALLCHRTRLSSLQCLLFIAFSLSISIFALSALLRRASSGTCVGLFWGLVERHCIGSALAEHSIIQLHCGCACTLYAGVAWILRE